MTTNNILWGSEATRNEFNKNKQKQISLSARSNIKRESIDSLDRVVANDQSSPLYRPSFNDAINSTSVEWPQVQACLNSDEATIEIIHFGYFSKKWTDSTLYAALVLRPGWPTPRMVYLGEQRQFDSLLVAGSASAEQINGLYRGGKTGRDYSHQLAKGRALSRLIWQPLDSLLSGVNSIIIAPSGRLHQVALAALPNLADTSRYTCMADRFQIRQVGSTRIVALPSSSSLFSANKINSYLYGGIVYETDSLALVRQVRLQARVEQRLARREATRSGSWPYLRGTQIEIRNLKQLLPAGRTTTLSGLSATEGSVKALSGRSPKVLHIATHGFFFPDLATTKRDQFATIGPDQNRFEVAEDPLLRSGLIMAGANYVWRGGTPIDGVDDGILTAYEVAGLDLRNTELVVLSACETGLGTVRSSEGVYGLQRAFKMAGVRYLLLSLWRVPDQETAQYMTLFYQRLLQTGSVPQAYRHAQAEMRNRYPQEPYKWAAFVLVE